MPKIKKTKWLKISIGSIFIVGCVFYFNIFFKQEKVKVTSQPKIQLDNNSDKNFNNKESVEVEKNSAKPFFISGWLPYWEKTEGVISLAGKMELFNEINPFAYNVNPDGSLRDTMQIKKAPWTKLRTEADKANVRIIPTIIWADAKAMHSMFSDSALRNAHMEKIIKMLNQNNFSGVDIDYEGKDMADRDLFSAFLEQLHQKLKMEEKSLSCTVEARNEDFPPEGLIGVRAMSFANDFNALNNFCDTVRLMAYDQVFQIHRSNIFEDNNFAPVAPNADRDWVQSVVDYALRFVSPGKIILGIPTYGWEFQYNKLSGGYRYTRVKSISYPKAMEKARIEGVDPVRTAGGELAFSYKTDNGDHIVTFSDAEAVRQKVELAKKKQLKGISLFKLDGLVDPEIFLLFEN